MDSIVTKSKELCVICDRPAECMHHCIYGNANREKSEKYGIVVPLCNAHHNMSNNSVHLNSALGKTMKIVGQLAAERQWVSEGMTLDEAREKFMKEFGISYI